MSTPDVRLTEAEREALTCDCGETSRDVMYCPSHAGMDHLSPDLSASYLVRTVEHIVSARIQQVEAERDKFRQWWEFAERVRARVEAVLDEALGTEEADGAGQGLAADVALLAKSRDNADRCAEAAEAKTAALIAAMQELADEWEADPYSDLTSRSCASVLRALLASTDTSALDKALAAERERIAQAIEALPGPGEVGIKGWPGEQQEAYLLAIEEAAAAARIAREGGESFATQLMRRGVEQMDADVSREGGEL